MLLIPHFIAPSPIHGLGCFSSANAKKGERLWEFHPIIDRVISQADLLTLPDHIVQLVQTHAEFFPDTAIFGLAADGAFFMNHSDDPNLEDFGDRMVARRNIEIGDEITCDYRVVKVWSFPQEGQDGAGYSRQAFEVVAQK